MAKPFDRHHPLAVGTGPRINTPRDLANLREAAKRADFERRLRPAPRRGPGQSLAPAQPSAEPRTARADRPGRFPSRGQDVRRPCLPPKNLQKTPRIALSFRRNRAQCPLGLTVSESPRKEHRMELNVHKEVAALQRLGAKQLRGRYAEVFGETTHRQQQDLADPPHRLAAAGPGRGRPVRTRPPPRRGAGQRRRPAPEPAPAQGRRHAPATATGRRRRCRCGTPACRPSARSWPASTGARRCRCGCWPTASSSRARSTPRSAPSPRPSPAATATVSSSSASTGKGGDR